MARTLTNYGQLAAIRAGFILQGITFKAWCRREGVDPGYAHRVAAGHTNGPKARLLRQRLLLASEGKAA
jgi:hypothetical protein